MTYVAKLTNQRHHNEQASAQFLPSTKQFIHLSLADTSTLEPLKNVLDTLVLHYQSSQLKYRSSLSLKYFELYSSDDDDELKDSIHLTRKRILKKRSVSQSVVGFKKNGISSEDTKKGNANLC
jgi:hypothetical protein